MGFHEVNFPDRISYGSSAGPGFNTNIVEMRTGIEDAIARSSNARRVFNAREGIKDHSDVYALIEFYLGRLGPANGFRFKDWTDYATTATGTTHNPGDASVDDEDFIIATGDGVTTEFQLQKTYTSGLQVRTRLIHKPVSGTVVVAVNGTAQTEGVDFTVNTTNGKITFTTAPVAAAEVSAGCQFDVPVRFGLEVDEVLPVDIESFDNETMGDVPLIELKNEDEFSDEFPAGGAINHGDRTGETAMTVLQGFCQIWESSSGTPYGNLPDFTNLPTGGPYFFVVNNGSVSLVIRDHLMTTIATVATGTNAAFFLLIDSLGVKYWQAF